MQKNNSKYIINNLNKLFPHAKCELKHRSHFQLLIAVILSAQTTDEKVNSVTNELFAKYPDAFSLAKANVKEVERIIKPIGLYKNKAKNIIDTSKLLVKDYKGKVLNNREILESLPGVGRKTCNVVLSNCFDVPAFAVDTHVLRVSKRLKIANESDTPEIIEEKLMTYFPKNLWGKLHHQFIFFGRYKCKSLKPDCNDCPFKKLCNYFE